MAISYHSPARLLPAMRFITREPIQVSVLITHTHCFAISRLFEAFAPAQNGISRSRRRQACSTASVPQATLLIGWLLTGCRLQRGVAHYSSSSARCTAFHEISAPPRNARTTNRHSQREALTISTGRSRLCAPWPPERQPPMPEACEYPAHAGLRRWIIKHPEKTARCKRLRLQTYRLEQPVTGGIKHA